MFNRQELCSSYKSAASYIAKDALFNRQELCSSYKSATSYIAKEALFHRQELCSSYKSDLRGGLSPGEENNPQHDTKLLLSV